MKREESSVMGSIDSSFRKDYPISVAGVLFVPLAFRRIFGDDPEIPYPKLAGMRPFAAYAGYSYGTLRTMLARWKKESLIETAGSEEPSRYRLGSLMESVMRARRERPVGMRFKVLVFSFTSDDARERYRMQQILKHFGFKRFAQNAYANVNFDDAGFREVLEEEGLQDKAFLFSQDGDEDPDMTRRLIALWNPPRIAEALERFALRLDEYLDRGSQDDEGLFCRFFFAGAAYYERFTSRLPNIPEDRIADSAPLTRIEKRLDDFRARYGKRMIRYYVGINE